MAATVISVINQKGGAGKTTTSINVAAWLAKLGYEVELVNIDPQGTALEWAEARAQQRPEDITFRVSSMGVNVHKEIGRIKTHNDFVIIDGAPNATALTTSAIKAADIVVIPLQPTQFDTWSTNSTLDLVTQVHELRDAQNPATYFLPTMVLKNSKKSRTFVDAIEEGYGFKALRSCTSQLLDYQDSPVGGGTVLDLNPEKQACHEMKMIAKELVEIAKDINHGN